MKNEPLKAQKYGIKENKNRYSVLFVPGFASGVQEIRDFLGVSL
jgi:hypothetical protein